MLWLFGNFMLSLWNRISRWSSQFLIGETIVVKTWNVKANLSYGRSTCRHFIWQLLILFFKWFHSVCWWEFSPIRNGSQNSVKLTITFESHYHLFPYIPGVKTLFETLLSPYQVPNNPSRSSPTRTPSPKNNTSIRRRFSADMKFSGVINVESVIFHNNGACKRPLRCR